MRQLPVLRVARTHAYRWVGLAAVACLPLGCGSNRLYLATPPAPMSAEALQVQFVPGTPSVSSQLAEHCQPVGAVQTLAGEESMRRAAAGLGADVVQIVYGSSSTSTDRRTVGYLTFTERVTVTGPSTVRFWRCSDD